MLKRIPALLKSNCVTVMRMVQAPFKEGTLFDLVPTRVEIYQGNYKIYT